MEFFKPRKKIILILVVLIVILLILNLLGLRLSNQEQSDNPPAISIPPNQKIEITGINPPPNDTLSLNPNQTFLINFSVPIKKEYFNVSLISQSIPPENPSLAEEVDIALTNNDSTLAITTRNPIKPSHSYELSLSNAVEGNLIYKVEYTSQQPKSTPAPNNDPSLSQFLPHEASNYALSYDQETNLYIFNFIFNPDLPDNAETQFEKAQQDAIKFIEEKGIDPNSLIIDWRFR